MAEWTRDRVDPSTINNGNEYTKNDQVSVQNLNSVVNSGLYAQDFAEHLADQPDTSDADNVGIPSVEIVDNVVGNKRYKKFKFSNLKGEKGDSGVVIPVDGELSTTSTNAVENKVVAKNIELIERSKQDILVAQPTEAGTTRQGQNDTVVEYWVSSDTKTWYRKWKSGWKECGIKGFGADLEWALRPFTFPITFDTPPTVVLGLSNAGEGAVYSNYSHNFYDRTNTSVSVYCDNNWQRDIICKGY